MAMKKQQSRRFVTYYSEGKIAGTDLLVDVETGVMYLFHRDGYCGGLTPLLGSDGKPMVADLEIKDESGTK